MASNLLNVNATIKCPHAAQASINSTNQKVKLNGEAVALFNDLTTVAGCAFTVPGPKPQPCVKVQWLVPATRVKVSGQFVLLSSSNGLCQSAEQIPQGPPQIATTQTKVTGI